MRSALFVTLFLVGSCLAGPICPKCGHEAADGWKFCPVDGALLQHSCPSCERAMQQDWLFCPYDASPLTEVAAPVTTPPAVGPDNGEESTPPGVSARPGPENPTSGTLDNGAPDKAAMLWFDLVRKGDRELLEQLMLPQFFEELDKEQYFENLLETANRVLFASSHIELLRLRIVKTKAELELHLIRPERPDDPLRYTFMLEEHEGRWFIVGIG